MVDMVVFHTKMAFIWFWRNTDQKLKFFSYAAIKTLRTGFITQNAGGKCKRQIFLGLF